MYNLLFTICVFQFIYKQITHTDVDLFIFCHILLCKCKCHWLPSGVGPRVNQGDCKMGGAKLIIPPRSGEIRKSPLVQLLLNGKSP